MQFNWLTSSSKLWLEHLPVISVEVCYLQQGFGDDSPPNRRLNCATSCYNWPPPSPQSTFYCQWLLGLSIPFSQENERQNLGKMECQSASHLPHHLLNRTKHWKGNHMHTLHVSACNFFSCFISLLFFRFLAFLFYFLLFDSFLVLFLFILI